MADEDKDLAEEDRLQDLQEAFLEAEAQGKLAEAEQARLLIENILTRAADEIEITMRWRGQPSEAREALVRWLEVLEVYLRMSMSTEHSRQFEQLSLSQDPIGILIGALRDLDRGVVQWILEKAVGKRAGPRAHDLRAAEFKAPLRGPRRSHRGRGRL